MTGELDLNAIILVGIAIAATVAAARVLLGDGGRE